MLCQNGVAVIWRNQFCTKLASLSRPLCVMQLLSKQRCLLQPCNALLETYEERKDVIRKQNENACLKNADR